MKDFNEAKKAYESVSVPEELNDRVQAGIRQGKRNRSRHVWSRSLGTAAACFAVLVGVLNLSPTVASAAADVPVLGGLFRVLTVRDYETEEGGIDYAVSVPGVESGSELAQQVNEEIQKRVDAHLAQAQADWAEYQDAFFATGGTEEEWGGRQMDVVIDYEIKSQSETTVSFVVDFAEGWVSAQQQRFCYNLDLADNRNITLQDLLGEDWVNICNNAVEAYIANSTDSEGFTFFFTPEEGGFTTVDADTAFYISESGAPVLVFPEYSIAAGAAGIVEIPVG